MSRHGDNSRGRNECCLCNRPTLEHHDVLFLRCPGNPLGSQVARVHKHCGKRVKGTIVDRMEQWLDDKATNTGVANIMRTP